MSDESKSGGGGGKGFGPKRPKATFGDVMLGIPAGRGGEREERGGGRDRDAGKGGRRDRPPPRENSRRDSPPASEAAGSAPASAEAPRKPRPEKKNRDRGPGRRSPEGAKAESKPQGPLVVVKRASGVIETRELSASDASSSATKSEGNGHSVGNGAAKDAPKAPDANANANVAEPEVAAPSAGSGEAAVLQPTPPRPTPYEEIVESQSFAELYEQSAKQEGPASRKHFRVGEKVTGKIFQLGADTAFVSLGGKSEAMIELRELKDEEGILRFGVGDTVEAHVVEAGAKGIILSKQLPKGSASMAMLAEARTSGMPVEGLILAVNKGGLEVAIGDVRAFCPASQIDVRFVGKLDEFVGEKHRFRVIEVRDRKVVISRRAIIEEEQKAAAVETRKNLAEGKVVKGKVTSVREFGVFVDLGGVEGMIPVSELSHARVGHPNEVVDVGDEVEVEVLKLEGPSGKGKGKDKERITLSMRSRQEDPWKAALAEITEGQQLKGKIVRLQPFGAFVELRPGVDGLIHISALANRRIAHPRDVVKVGEEVTVQVEKVDPEEKRIGLRLVTEEGVVIAVPAPVAVAAKGEGGEAAESKGAREPKEPRVEAPRPKVGQLVTGKIDRIEQYGVFLAFPGGTGLVPASETGTDRGTDMKRAFHLGQELKVQIIEISGGKTRLSVTAALKAEERADMEAWKKTQKGAGGKGFGTLGDLLKGKLGPQ